MTQLKCDSCGNTSLVLLSSNIQGLSHVIDIYFCKKCQQSKTISTPKNKNSFVENNIKLDLEDIDVPDFDEPDYEEVFEEPQNPYDDNDGGWDPSIG
jgi:hypothetical protein